MKGYILVIEGTDGSGKQTQANLIKDNLSKLISNNVFEISFPNYDSISSGPLKMYLSGKLGSNANYIDAYQASTLFAADRLCTYYTDIKSHYDNGDVIILDRYTPSNALHQAGKIDNIADKNKFLDWLFDYEYNILKLPKPDKVIFLNMPTEASKKLREARNKINGYKSSDSTDIHESDPNHIEHAYRTGMYVALKYGWDIVPCVDSKGNILGIDTINEHIMNIIMQDIQKR